jgi:hypothetical protein
MKFHENTYRLGAGMCHNRVNIADISNREYISPLPPKSGYIGGKVTFVKYL